MKGDRVEIVIDAGEATRTYEVAATRAGRRVEITTRRGVVEVSEVTRTGSPVPHQRRSPGGADGPEPQHSRGGLTGLPFVIPPG
jgi:hypothetical protein